MSADKSSIADQNTRALLVDIDSTIPNLALMHISAYIKSRGGQAGWNTENPTHAYISCIFRRNRHTAVSSAKMLEVQYPGIKVDIGGSGYDLYKRMPKEVELMPPDYSLYPECDHGIGYTTRGCKRNCHFCVVPCMYDGIEISQHPSELRNGNSKHIRILDDNILFNKARFYEVTDYIIQEGLTVEFENLDIRLTGRKVVKRLAELNHIGPFHFAFDDLDYAYQVVRGVNYLKEGGISPRSCIFYVYLDNDREFDNALERCNILRSCGTNAYLMINGDIPSKKRTQRMIDLKRWCFPSAFWKTPFSEYDRHAVKTHRSTEEEGVANV